MQRWPLLSVLCTLAPAWAVPPEQEPSMEPAAPPSAQAARDWVPCGRAAFLLRDIRPGAASSDPTGLTHGPDTLFFSADDGVTGRELWKSSGTGGQGTFRVRDLWPGSPGSEPSDITRLGDRVLFAADDGIRGRELWRSDGSSSGTLRVKDIFPGAPGSGPEGLFAFKGSVYFSADDGTHGRELWRSDGTLSGTRLVEDIFPGEDDTGAPFSSFPGQFTLGPDGALYFTTCSDPSCEGATLWRSEGGPRLLQLASNEGVDELTRAGRFLFFVESNEGQNELRRTDGTQEGTLTLTERDSTHALTAVGSRVFFINGFDLWVSDGTVAGTRLVKAFTTEEPGPFAALGHRLFFAANDGTGLGRELWVSDGTPEGTFVFKDLEPGAAGSSPEELTAIQGTLFFSADTAGPGREPWVSDGTVVGTRALDEVNPGPASSNPREFVRSGWDVFFAAEDVVHGRELWAVPFRPPDACDAGGR